MYLPKYIRSTVETTLHLLLQKRREQTPTALRFSDSSFVPDRCSKKTRHTNTRCITTPREAQAGQGGATADSGDGGAVEATEGQPLVGRCARGLRVGVSVRVAANVSFVASFREPNERRP